MSYKNWTLEEENQLKELVATGLYSFRQIGVIMGRSVHSVTSHARQYLDIFNNKYETRKYKYKENFFETPNVINSYVAGFWAADGNLTKTNTGYRLRIEISTLDEGHLQWMKDIMGHEGPLNQWGEKRTKFFQMHVSEEYGKQLGDNFGVIPNKAHRLQPPNLQDFDLKFAYLLGLLDGDGCVHLSNNNILSVGYVSCSLMAVEWYKNMIEFMNFPSVQRNTKTPVIGKLDSKNAYKIIYCGARAICLIQLAQYFAQKHNLPILARKWNNPAIHQYIKDFYIKFPNFSFNPEQHYLFIQKSL